MTTTMTGFRFWIFAALVSFASAFAPSSLPRATTTTTRLHDSMEQIEFKIHYDGRVEEVVRGIKGDECLKVTETINKALGRVIEQKPTEEMYEQEEIKIQETVQETVSNGFDTANDTPSWEGQSSW